ncbi:MAG: hypothetical protein IKE29_09725 [Paenibacillus sp.]|uniref:hypothetical protein n=1 Tax=Paenibacillus sp. TaxID=58172 RepID=UPI0025D1DE3C|nr:hypothetical protein [Paenibacillus sp.]MBR2564891.1 hypothetical protein [Paenibacillus sp.]
MEFELFLFSTYEAEDIAKMLIDSDATLDFEMKVYEGSRVYIGCEFFSMNIEIEDISDLGFIMDNYGLKLNLCIDFQVYNKTFSTGVMHMLETIGKILSQIQGDILLLSNNSTQVLRREKEVLYVNNMEEFSEFPFDALKIAYKETELM